MTPSMLKNLIVVLTENEKSDSKKVSDLSHTHSKKNSDNPEIYVF